MKLPVRLPATVGIRAAQELASCQDCGQGLCALPAASSVCSAAAARLIGMYPAVEECDMPTPQAAKLCNVESLLRSLPQDSRVMHQAARHRFRQSDKTVDTAIQLIAAPGRPEINRHAIHVSQEDSRHVSASAHPRLRNTISGYPSASLRA